MKNRMKKISAITILLLTSLSAFGWWDTVIKNWKYPPLKKRYEAETLGGIGKKDIVKDPLASDGKAVALTENGAVLKITEQLKPSTYVLYVVARSPRSQDKLDPGGMKPFYYRFSIKGPDNQTTHYRIRAAYQYTYPMVYGPQETARCYFIAPQAGAYRIEVRADQGSTAGVLWVDTLEIRDVLGNCPGGPHKARRFLTSDEELYNIRGGKACPVTLPQPAEITRVCAQYWASFPPLNAPRQSSANPAHYREKNKVPTPAALREWEMNPIDQPWALINKKEKLRYTQKDWDAGRAIETPFHDDGWGLSVEGLHVTWGDPAAPGSGGCFSIMGPLFYRRVQDLFAKMARSANQFEKTGNVKDALDATAILLAFSYYYPALDLRAQHFWPGSFGRYYFTNQLGNGFLIAGQKDGWEVRKIMKTYDQVFDFIKDNQALADFLGTRVPGIKTPADVIGYLDRHCTQRAVDTIFRLDVNGRTIKATIGVVLAALCQGPTPVSQAWIDQIFMNNPLGESEAGGLEDLLYSSLGRDGLVSEGSGGYSKSKIMGLVGLAEMLKKYKDQGGHLPLSLLDFNKYPWLRDAFYAPINLRVAGGWVPLIGDYGDPLRLREVYFDNSKASKPFYLAAWRMTGDPAFAYLTHRYKRTVETSEEWQKIAAAAKTVRNPLNTIQPRIMDDFGLAVLELGQGTDDYTRKKAVVFRYGSGQIHAHNDGLSFSLFGKGTRAISDLAARHGTPNPRLQKMHNTLVVDDQSMCNEGLTVPGWGWLNAFVPMGDIQYVNASYRALSHPQLNIYRRGVALINVDEDNAYAFSVARVKGGKTTTFCAHANANDAFTCNAPLKPVVKLTKENKTYLADSKPFTIDNGAPINPDLLPRAMAGKATSPLIATWRLNRKAEKSFLKKELPKDQRIFGRWQLFGHQGDAVYAADGTSKKYRYDMTFLYVRKAPAAALGEVYPALADVYQGKPVVQRARQLTVQNPGKGAKACVALEVTLPGKTDVCLSGDGATIPHTIEGKIEFNGMFGFIRRDQQGIKRATLVNGTTLKAPGISLSLPRARNEGVITAIDPTANTIKVRGSFGDVDFNGRVIQLVTRANRAWSFTVVQTKPIADGVLLKLKERLKIYQARISHLNEKKGLISVLGEPHMLKADHHWYDHTLLMNEAQTRTWPARMICQERWVIVKTPVHKTDIPDVNGDGKRLLKLIGNKHDKGKDGKTLLEMEVTRVDPKRGTIFFKMPPAAPYNRGGWEYVNRRIVSESGKTWMATYPGYDYQIAVDGAVKLTDFTDANSDGRTVLSLLRVAPGARMVMPNFIAVERTPKGTFKVASSSRQGKCTAVATTQ